MIIRRYRGKTVQINRGENEKSNVGGKYYASCFMISLMCILVLSGCSVPWKTNTAESLTLSVADTVDSESGGAEADSVSADSSGSNVVTICVYICGQVEREGVYMMDEDCRVYQVIARAGGLKEDADLSGINQAARVEDGAKIYIPKVGEEVQTDENGTGISSDSADDGKVNINTADKNELMTLNGIGEARAESIIHYRETNGVFAKPEDLKNVSGIGDGIFGKIQEDICV